MLLVNGFDVDEMQTLHLMRLFLYHAHGRDQAAVTLDHFASHCELPGCLVRQTRQDKHIVSLWSQGEVRLQRKWDLIVGGRGLNGRQCTLCIHALDRAVAGKIVQHNRVVVRLAKIEQENAEMRHQIDNI